MMNKMRFNSLNRRVRPNLFSTAAAPPSAGQSQSESYNTAMQAMHWIVGGSILACVGFVQAAQWEKPGKKKGQLMFYHKSFGLLAAGLMLPRLALRISSKIPAHIPGASWEVLAANVSHASLYGFMVFMPVTGVVMGAYSGFGLPFFYTTFPSVSKDPATAKLAYEYHKLVGHYAQYLIPLHVGAVGYHYLIKGQNILPRILSLGSK